MSPIEIVTAVGLTKVIVGDASGSTVIVPVTLEVLPKLFVTTNVYVVDAVGETV